MAFKCACFISYPHNAGKSVDKFVTRLKEELEDRFAQFVTDPIVTDHDFPTGANFNKAIAQSICESACLLVVYMPVYQRKKFCLQEYTAMERLQVQRYTALKQDLSGKLGMILPLIYTGEEDTIPGWIDKRINYKNIRDFTLSDPMTVFDDEKFKTWVVEMAHVVNNLYNTFQGTSLGSPCGGADLPDENDPDVITKLHVPTQATESFR